MAKAKVSSNSYTIRVPEEYGGQYIAKRTWQSKSIVAHSPNMAQVIKKSQKQGVMEPVIMFVPKHDMVCIY